MCKAPYSEKTHRKNDVQFGFKYKRDLEKQFKDDEKWILQLNDG